MSWQKRMAACAFAVAALLVWAASPAAAHARLLSATPAAGATTARAPAEVRLTFDGPPYDFGLGVVVLTAGGQHIESGRVRVDGNTVVQPLAVLPAPGTYLVRWRVVSADGHPVSGQYAFAYEPDGATASVPPTVGASGSGGGTHAWLLLGLAAAAVLGLTALLVLPGRRRRLEDVGTLDARGSP
jgi:copper resistance protein C